MLRDLKVRLSTSSYTLSNKSLDVVNGHVALHVSCSDHVPRTFFSRVSWMIGMMTSCTCVRISGEESMDDTICRIVSIHDTPSSYQKPTVLRVFATPIAAYVLSSSPSASISASKSSPLGALSSLAIASRKRRMYDSHCLQLGTDTSGE